MRKESDEVQSTNKADLQDAYTRDTNTERSTSASKSEFSSAVKSRNSFGTQRHKTHKDVSRQRDLSEQTIQKMKDECQDKVKQMYLKKFLKSFKVNSSILF